MLGNYDGSFCGSWEDLLSQDHQQDLLDGALMSQPAAAVTDVAFSTSATASLNPTCDISLLAASLPHGMYSGCTSEPQGAGNIPGLLTNVGLYPQPPHHMYVPGQPPVQPPKPTPLQPNLLQSQHAPTGSKRRTTAACRPGSSINQDQERILGEAFRALHSTLNAQEAENFWTNTKSWPAASSLAFTDPSSQGQSTVPVRSALPFEEFQDIFLQNGVPTSAQPYSFMAPSQLNIYGKSHYMSSSGGTKADTARKLNMATLSAIGLHHVAETQLGGAAPTGCHPAAAPNLVLYERRNLRHCLYHHDIKKKNKEVCIAGDKHLCHTVIMCTLAEVMTEEVGQDKGKGGPRRQDQDGWQKSEAVHEDTGKEVVLRWKGWWPALYIALPPTLSADDGGTLASNAAAVSMPTTMPAAASFGPAACATSYPQYDMMSHPGPAMVTMSNYQQLNTSTTYSMLQQPQLLDGQVMQQQSPQQPLDTCYLPQPPLPHLTGAHAMQLPLLQQSLDAQVVQQPLPTQLLGAHYLQLPPPPQLLNAQVMQQHPPLPPLPHLMCTHMHAMQQSSPPQPLEAQVMQQPLPPQPLDTHYLQLPPLPHLMSAHTMQLPLPQQLLGTQVMPQLQTQTPFSLQCLHQHLHQQPLHHQSLHHVNGQHYHTQHLSAQLGVTAGTAPDFDLSLLGHGNLENPEELAKTSLPTLTEALQDICDVKPEDFEDVLGRPAESFPGEWSLIRELEAGTPRRLSALIRVEAAASEAGEGHQDGMEGANNDAVDACSSTVLSQGDKDAAYLGRAAQRARRTEVPMVVGLASAGMAVPMAALGEAAGGKAAPLQAPKAKAAKHVEGLLRMYLDEEEIADDEDLDEVQVDNKDTEDVNEEEESCGLQSFKAFLQRQTSPESIQALRDGHAKGYGLLNLMLDVGVNMAKEKPLGRRLQQRLVEALKVVWEVIGQKAAERWAGHSEAAQRLLLMQKDEEWHDTALHMCARFNLQVVLKWLLARSDTTALVQTTKCGWTALHTACRAGHLGPATMFLSHGRNLGLFDRPGAQKVVLADLSGCNKYFKDMEGRRIMDAALRKVWPDGDGPQVNEDVCDGEAHKQSAEALLAEFQGLRL